jgi:hypothetical protein
MTLPPIQNKGHSFELKFATATLIMDWMEYLVTNPVLF